MASSRMVLGSVILLLLGFIWAPIWILTNASDDAVDVHGLFVDDDDEDTYPRVKHSDGSPNPPKQTIGDLAPKKKKRKKTKPIENSVILKKPSKIPTMGTMGRRALNSPGKEAGHGRYHATVNTTGMTHGWVYSSTAVNKTVEYAGTQPRMTTTKVCSKMSLLRSSTVRWINKICEALKRQPVYLRAALVVAMGLASLIVTLIAYKLMCPRVYKREGIEKLYDMEDSWLIFT